MDKDEQIKYWLNSSEEDWLTASEISEKNERRYISLFLGHLSLEKLFKALYVKKFDSVPPYKHDLYLFAEKCNVELDETTLNDLKIVNDFNLQTRYPDYKNEFYKKCTPEFVAEELQRIDKLRKWIRNLINNMP